MTNEYSSKAEELKNKLHSAFASLHFHNYHDKWTELAGEKWIEECKAEVSKQLTDLITQARIDELEMIDSRGELYAPYIKKRYDELQSTLKKEQ